MSAATRRKIATISVALLVVGLIVGGILGIYVVPPREVTKEVVTTTTVKEVVTTTREVPKKVTVTTTKEVPKEIPMKLSVLAEKIRKGEIDVGEVYGMAPGQRYHTIHATTLGLDCASCHVKKVAPETIFAQIPSGAPGPVDKRVCLGCHLTGPASNLYSP